MNRRFRLVASLKPVTKRATITGPQADKAVRDYLDALTHDDTDWRRRCGMIVRWRVVSTSRPDPNVHPRCLGQWKALDQNLLNFWV